MYMCRGLDSLNNSEMVIPPTDSYRSLIHAVPSGAQQSGLEVPPNSVNNHKLPAQKNAIWRVPSGNLNITIENHYFSWLNQLFRHFQVRKL